MPRGYDKDGNPLGGHPNVGRKRKGADDKAVQIILTVPPTVKNLYDEATPKARKAARKVAALAMRDILSKNRLTD